mmetsp:Transcript_116410/g.173902  ORF Transcript_116410/g.173902 Transcript_116410/m.173902 type:complete len:251 (-) Transcript_116410:25-777(-)
MDKGIDGSGAVRFKTKLKGLSWSTFSLSWSIIPVISSFFCRFHHHDLDRVFVEDTDVMPALLDRSLDDRTILQHSVCRCRACSGAPQITAAVKHTTQLPLLNRVPSSITDIQRSRINEFQVHFFWVDFAVLVNIELDCCDQETVVGVFIHSHRIRTVLIHPSAHSMGNSSLEVSLVKDVESLHPKLFAVSSNLSGNLRQNNGKEHGNHGVGSRVPGFQCIYHPEHLNGLETTFASVKYHLGCFVVVCFGV